MARLAIRKLEDCALTPLGNIVKAEDFQRIVAGQEMIAEIKRQAETLYKQKKSAAYKAAQSQVQASSGEQMLDVAAASIEYLSRFERRLTEIVIAAVTKIIGDWEPNDAAARMVKNALRQVRKESRVTLRMSPDQVPVVKQKIDEIVAAYPAIEFVDVVADPAIADGACRLETMMGVLDTSIDTQIKVLQKALAKNFVRRDT